MQSRTASIHGHPIDVTYIFTWSEVHYEERGSYEDPWRAFFKSLKVLTRVIFLGNLRCSVDGWTDITRKRASNIRKIISLGGTGPILTFQCHLLGKSPDLGGYFD